MGYLFQGVVQITLCSISCPALCHETPSGIHHMLMRMIKYIVKIQEWSIQMIYIKPRYMEPTPVKLRHIFTDQSFHICGTYGIAPSYKNF